MRILVVGAGSVGLGIASCLLKNGNEVVLVGRRETCAELAAQGLLRTGIFGTHQAAAGDFQLCSSLGEVPHGDYDCVLVCTKSFDSEAAAKELKESGLLAVNAMPIVLFQNGYGNFQQFAKFFAEEQVFVARVITGFKRLRPNHVEITVHASPIRIGSFLPNRSVEMAPLSRSISEGGIPAEVSGTIEKDLWSKILYNALLNPLGAIFRVPYGRLGESSESRETMGEVAKEAFLVMNARGYSTYWEGSEDFLEAFYSTMLPPTAAHESSMLQDLKAGKRTEIDALNGAIVKLGSLCGVSTPVNQTLCNLIRFLERRSS